SHLLRIRPAQIARDDRLRNFARSPPAGAPRDRDAHRGARPPGGRLVSRGGAPRSHRSRSLPGEHAARGRGRRGASARAVHPDVEGSGLTEGPRGAGVQTDVPAADAARSPSAFAAAGRATVTVVPFPGALSTWIVPPCSAM